MVWVVNEAQRAVLAWLVGGQSGDPPSQAWKTSARSLSSRGLVAVSRRGGTYAATVTAAGQFFHEHGQYPQGSSGAKWAPDSLVAPDVLEARRLARITAARPKPAEAGKATTATRKAAGTPPGSRVGLPSAIKESSPPRPPMRKLPASSSREPVPPPSGPAIRISKPHPAVKSLMDHPAGLPKDPAGRRRGFVAAHALVKAALDAGFDVTGHVQPSTRIATSPYLGEKLVTLDAGRQPVLVRIGELDRRVDHVPTAQEKARQELYSWASPPSHDWEPTGLLFFRVYVGRNGTKISETSRVTLADRVPKVIALVAEATLAAERAEERRRQHEADQRALEEARRRLAERRHHYERWEKILLDQHADGRRAADERAFVRALRTRPVDDHRLAAFLDWADGYADMLDPTLTIRIPVGEVPDLTHEERLKHGRPPESPQLRPPGWGW